MFPSQAPVSFVFSVAYDPAADETWPIWQCPILAYGPGDSTLDHTPHEHIDLKEYHQAINVLALVLADL